jgi:hypothetical protein
MLAILALLVVSVPTATATTTTDLETGLLSKINAERSARGLVPLRAYSKLWSIAGTRAARMASTNVLSHSIAGSVSSQLGAKHVPWYAYGEDIGYTRAKRGTTAMNELFRLWKASPEHWKLMMSSRFNYVGVGFAYRSSNGKTFGSIIFTESRDITNAIARMDSARPSGNSATWNWHGWDPLLQTHLAGLHSYDVQIRIDSGDWRTLMSKTTATSRSITGTSGHAYGLRVRARDKAGNIGRWSTMTVRLP